jgi:ABC-2 type transport system ATP-binding protein
LSEIITVQNVKKYFKTVKAVDDVSLRIRQGEYVALLGPNGAGKTTLVEMIEGIQKPDSGDIRIRDMDWRSDAARIRNIIGLSLQETRFFDKLSVAETLNLFASFFGLGKDAVDRVIDLVNLDEKRDAWSVNLSGGQRQRLALAIALLNKPEVLLLDEPTTGLDPTSRREIWDILTHLKAENNTTMILTTHYMEEASFLCDRIVIMDHGKILARGTLNELLSENIKGEVIEFSTDSPFDQKQFPLQKDILKYTFNEDLKTGRLVVEDIVSYLPAFIKHTEIKKMHLTSLECRKMTLDDLFLSMTGRTINEEAA